MWKMSQTRIEPVTSKRQEKWVCLVKKRPWTSCRMVGPWKPQWAMGVPCWYPDFGLLTLTNGTGMPILWFLLPSWQGIEPEKHCANQALTHPGTRGPPCQEAMLLAENLQVIAWPQNNGPTAFPETPGQKVGDASSPLTTQLTWKPSFHFSPPPIKKASAH